MALQGATYVENGKVVGGFIPDTASAIGYKENVGGTCANPNGYTAGSFFMALNNGYMYKALTNIAKGDAFQIGTNCEQTNVSTELDALNQHLTELLSEVQNMGMKSKSITLNISTSPNPTVTLADYGISVDSADDYWIEFDFYPTTSNLISLTKTATQFSFTWGSSSSGSTFYVTMQVNYKPSV